MKNKKYFIVLIFFIYLGFSFEILSDELKVTVFALEAMPYCGVVNGKPAGVAIDILTESTKYGAPEFHFRFDLSWLRAQNEINRANDKLVAIIPFSRTLQRENKYKWVGQLLLTQSRFYSYNRHAPIKSIEEAKKITIGVVRGHAIIANLKKIGITKLEESASNATINASKLYNGRYDTIADSDLICLYNWKKIGKNTKDLQEGIPFGDVTRVYIAANLNFPDNIAKSISVAIKEMEENGKLKEILDRWR